MWNFPTFNDGNNMNNKTFSCYIIDDELHAINILKDLISINSKLELIGFQQDEIVGINSIVNAEVSPDILFLDINMPKLSGIKAAELVRPYTHVIITTAFADYGLQAFEADVYDYLLKPISHDKFIQSISKVAKLIETSIVENVELSNFFVKGDNKGKHIKINIQEISFIEAALNYVIIHTDNILKQQITYLTMNEILGSLPRSFMRIHKSYIVNTAKISLVSGSNIHLENNSILTIGSSYKEAFWDYFNNLVVKSKRF